MSTLRKPEGIFWNAAPVELPEMPTISPGPDAMSATIAAVLPTLAAEMTTNVTTLAAKENLFSGKVVAAEAAYQNSESSGSQAVGQVVGMLGQIGQQAGQMGQLAGAPAGALGGQAGTFGSLMQQAMQAAQSGGGQTPAGAGAPAPAAAPGQPRADAPAQAPVEAPAGVPEPDAQEDAQQQEAREDRERAPLHRADESTRPVPVTPPEPRQQGGEGGEVTRNL